MVTFSARIEPDDDRSANLARSGFPPASLGSRRLACVPWRRKIVTSRPARLALRGLLSVFVLMLAIPPGTPDLSRLALARRQATAPATPAEAAYQQALAEFAEAEDEVERAEEHRRQRDGEAAQQEGALRTLDQATLQQVLAFETTLRRARDLAVDAYVRGGRQHELAMLLSSGRGDEALVRGQLLAGGVDGARDAAATLQSKRLSLDREVAQVGAQVAALRGDLDLADRAVEVARINRQAAYEAVLIAFDRLAEAVARSAAEERAQAEARAGTEAAADVTEGSNAEDPPAPRPPASRVTPRPANPQPSPPPPPPPPASDAKAEAWAKVRECESGGNYQAIGGGGLYRGAYQFSQATWESVGGTGDPAQASPEDQDYRARLLYERSGSGQWPYCGRYLEEA